MSDKLKYRDIIVELFPAMIQDLDKAINSIDDTGDFMLSSGDFLLALVSINMLMKDNWLEELEGVLDQWQIESDS